MRIEYKKKIDKLCIKLKEGSPVGRGLRYEPNSYIDFPLFATHLTDKGKRPATIIDYLKWIHKFNVPVNEKNIEDYDKHITKPKENPASNTIKRMNYLVYISMREYLKAIEKKDLLKLLPITHDVPKVKSKPKSKSYSNADWELLMTFLDDDTVKDAMVLMRELGLRVGEIINMRKDWIIEHEIKSVTRPFVAIPANVSKSREYEEVPIDEKSLETIKKYMQDKKKFGLLFTSNNPSRLGNKMNYNDFANAFAKVNRKHKTKAFSHKSRHQYAHDCERLGFLTSKIQTLMRHSDISTTGRYLQKDEADVYDEFFKAKNKPKEEGDDKKEGGKNE